MDINHMDINKGILVAMMFVMLLSLGIVNLMGGFAALVSKRSRTTLYGLQLSWMLLLLLSCFRLFWHTVDLLGIEDWGFLQFLFVMMGPMLLFYAADRLVPDFSGDKPPDLKSHYFGIHREFFAVLFLIQIWTLGVDLVLNSGFPAEAYGNLAAAAFFVVLASQATERVHHVASLAIWIVFLLSPYLPSLLAT